MTHHTKRKCDLPRVPEWYAGHLIGRLVHLSWAYAGSVWRVKGIDGRVVTLVTPKTGNERTDDVKNLCFTRDEERIYEAFCYAMKQKQADALVTEKNSVQP